MMHTILRVAAVLIVVAVAAAQTPAPGLEGTWRGTLGPLRLVLRIEKAPDGLYIGMLDSVDQGSRIPITSVTMAGDTVKLDVKAVNGTFEGTLNAARTELKGTWNQGVPQPLVFTRDSSAPAAPAPGATATDATAPVTAAAFPMGLPLDLHVPIAPTLFVGSDGKTYLVHELHVTNMSNRDFLIARVEVLGGETTLASYEGGDLNSVLSARPGAQDRRVVPAGRRVVVFVWIASAPATAQGSLRHRVTVGELTVTGAPIVVSTQKPITIAPPLKGDGWRAGNGPGRDSGHRRALIAVEGGARIAQRFAIDWVKLGPDGRTFTGNAQENRSYHAYGVDALAVADGTVAALKDGIPENVPGLTSRAVPITLDTIGGNHVVLDLGSGRFVFYAHLQPGSLRVKVGDRVKTGLVLGLVGNSGNSTEPHLHFHITNGPSPLGSEGLPYSILGKTGIPLQNDRVDFGK